jgi:hypothetical protein
MKPEDNKYIELRQTSEKFELAMNIEELKQFSGSNLCV